MVKQLPRWLSRFHLKGWTVSEELTRQGYLSHSDLHADRVYNRANVANAYFVVYFLLAPPVVLIMKLSPAFSGLIIKIGWKYWLKKSIVGGYEILAELSSKRMNPDNGHKKRVS